MGIEDDLALINQALIDANYGPMPEHDPLCRVFSGWPDQREKGCNCSVARNESAQQALKRIRRTLLSRQDAL